MRSSKHPKFEKPGPRTKIRKKRQRNSWYMPFGNHVSDKNIENINEALRKNKSACCDSSGSWKLLPKDSCEVYRDRRRRQQKQSRDGSLSEEQLGQNQSKMQRKRRKRWVRDVKKQKPTQKNERRPHSDSTMLSNSDSYITASLSLGVCPSCASSSEMES